MPIEITSAHISRLVELESKIQYDEPPSNGEEPFTTVTRPSPVLLSAPHGARTYRNNSKERWHEEDEYTAGMALLLSELCGTSVIATTAKNQQHDPNYHKSCAYKAQLNNIIEECGVRFVLDLHGSALHSGTLGPNQTIDLGYRSEKEEERSMGEVHIRKFESFLRAGEPSGNRSCFVVGRNHFKAHGGKISEPITTFVYRLNPQDRVQALQIEMKPQVRIAYRFPTASLFKSCGTYTADTNCIIHMLQSLIDFVEYLETLS